MNSRQAELAQAAGYGWKSVGPVGVRTSSIAIDLLTPATVYAGTNDGIYKSVDGGRNWRPINNGLGDAGQPVIDPVTPTTIYVVTYEHGVFKTTDGGTSWNSASNGLANTFVISLAINHATPSTLYAGTYAAGVFKSVDGGASWSLAYCRCREKHPFSRYRPCGAPNASSSPTKERSQLSSQQCHCFPGINAAVQD